MGEYPKLMWAPDGREFTVHDEAEEHARLKEGFRFAVDPVAATPLEDDPAPEPHKKAKK